MLTIKVTHPFGEWPILRQFPNADGIWGNCRFHLNDDTRECDFWVVILQTAKPETVLVPARNLLFLPLEFPEIQPHLDRTFLAQFATILSFGRTLDHPDVVDTWSPFPWMMGAEVLPGGRVGSYRSFHELETLFGQPKTRLLSVISSNKAFTAGHRSRLAFVDRLKRHFGDRLDVYGRGIRDFRDKWEAIGPYKYHIALENSACRGGMSEKLYDAFLAGTYPLYFGCTNVHDYFTDRQVTPIDMHDPERAIAIIEQAIQSERFEANRAELEKAREQVLHRFNLFPLLAEFCERRFAVDAPRVPVTVTPEVWYSGSILNKLKRRLAPVKNALAHWFGKR